MFFRIILLVTIAIFSLLGYVTYLNHEINVTLFLVRGKPLTTSLPAVIIVSFAFGALIVFVAGLIRDLVARWNEVRRERKKRRQEITQGEIIKGLVLLSKGDIEQGKSHLTTALKRDPENQDILVTLGDINTGQGKLQEALEILERAWAIDPDKNEILLKKARLLDQMGHPTMAIDTFQRVLERDSNNLPALMALRDVYLRQHEWKDALNVQRRILKVVKNEPDSRRERGLFLGIRYEYAQSLMIEGNTGSLEESLGLCKEIIRHDKGFHPAYLLMGDIYQKQRRWAEAGRILGRGFRVSRSMIFLLRLEELYLRRDDPRTLLKIYRRTLENHPDNMIIPFFYAKLCLRLEMLDEAMDELVEIRERGTDLAPLHGLMAQVLAEKGRLDEAVREYKTASERAASLQPSFVCTSCQRKSSDWLARCPSCNKWNTYFLEGEEVPSANVPA